MTELDEAGKKEWNKIPLSKGRHALVDAKDYAWLSKSNWFVSSCGYAARNIRKENGTRSQVLMHRLILKTPDGMETDHINGDRLDNRGINLRIATSSQNQFNSRKQRSSFLSKFKGVSFDRSKFRRKPWLSVINFQGKRLYLGKYACEVQAAMAYNLKAVEVGGQFARLNRIMPSHIATCNKLGEVNHDR